MEYLLNDKANSADDMKRLQQRATTFQVIGSEPAVKNLVEKAEKQTTAEKAVTEGDRKAAMIEQAARQAVERQRLEAAERQRQQAEEQRQASETAPAHEAAQRAVERAGHRRVGRSL